MLSVIIPTEGLEQPPSPRLRRWCRAAAGVVREVLLVDRSGSGVIERVADVAGCRFLPFEGSRAAALAAGARQARSPWLMFLHAGAALTPAGSTRPRSSSTAFRSAAGRAPESFVMPARPMRTPACATA